MFGVWSLVKFLSMYLILPLSIIAVFLIFSDVGRRLFERVLPILGLYGSKAIVWIVGFTVSTYMRINAVFRWTGCLVDFEPIGEDCPEYRHSVLPTQRSIRLLVATRRYPWGPLELQLNSYDLDSCPPYEAISYRWGDEKPTPLIISGHRLVIKSENALRVISGRASFWHPKLIWIDSVCVNQNDIEERNQQVLLMRDVYRQASRVIVWLGAPEHTLSATPALQVFIFLLGTYSRINDPNIAEGNLKSVLQIGTKEWGWRNLLELLQNPYWRRAWVLQEIAVATTVHLYLGGIMFSWDSFAEIIDSLHSSRVGSLYLRCWKILLPTYLRL